MGRPRQYVLNTRTRALLEFSRTANIFSYDSSLSVQTHARVRERGATPIRNYHTHSTLTLPSCCVRIGNRGGPTSGMC